MSLTCLSRINPNDTSTRVVRFPINDFRAIMDLGRINIDRMKSTTNSLLSRVINVPRDKSVVYWEVENLYNAKLR